MLSSTPALRYALFAACSLLVPNIAFAHNTEAILIMAIGPWVLLISFLILLIGLYKTNKNGGSIGRKIARCTLSLLFFIGMSLIFGGLTLFSGEEYFIYIFFITCISILCFAYLAPKLARKIIK